MKFENPKLEISMFDVENIVTGSNDAVVDAKKEATTILSANGYENVKGIIGFTFE